jgi:hypothetical protein
MGLDEQLSELLAHLGVVLEGTGADDGDKDAAERGDGEASPQHVRAARQRQTSGRADEGGGATSGPAGERLDEDLVNSIEAVADISLFQTSREHYGVFYRLDLTAGVPQLRIFLPDDEGGLKMRCYFVRAALGSPLHEWFATDRSHAGSAAYNDARDSAQQHLLFAAGELMKKLFWTGDIEQMRFPSEIEVVRLA